MVSIATQIERIKSAKTAMKTALQNKGVTVPANATLDSYAGLINSIPSGSGGETAKITFTVPSGVAFASRPALYYGGNGMSLTTNGSIAVPVDGMVAVDSKGYTVRAVGGLFLAAKSGNLYVYGVQRGAGEISFTGSSGGTVGI